MGGGKGGGGDSEQTIRYARYIESAHGDLLNDNGNDSLTGSVFSFMNLAMANPVDVEDSPYHSYGAPPVNDAFFGSGFTLDSFPTLYDMFGRFMGGMDICDLWEWVYQNTVHSPEIEASVSAHAALLDDDIQTKILPRFTAGMRDINSVMGSSFIIGKSIIENARVKSLNNFQAEIRMKAVAASIQIWERHLEWNKAVTQMYAEYAKMYYNVRETTDRTTLEYMTKDYLWNLNLFEYGRSMVGALNGAAATSGGGSEPSQIQKSVSGVMAGAATGAMVTGGNPVGAVIGGAIGLAASFF